MRNHLFSLSRRSNGQALLPRARQNLVLATRSRKESWGASGSDLPAAYTKAGDCDGRRDSEQLQIPLGKAACVRKGCRVNNKTRIRAVCLVLGAMAILAMGLFRVHRRHQVIRVGYELSELRTELRALQEEENRLRLEESVLTNPGRIELLATGFGMVRPTPEQFRVITSDDTLAKLNEPNK
jgi:cell division protein FtsL